MCAQYFSQYYNIIYYFAVLYIICEGFNPFYLDFLKIVTLFILRNKYYIRNTHFICYVINKFLDTLNVKGHGIS